MMMLTEAASALQARFIGLDRMLTSVGSDSRSISNGQLFVALKGESFDGHDYAATAIKQGAAAVLVSNTLLGAEPAIVVEDTYEALGKLASYWRNKFDIPLVAITGSNGKTTVKEMLTAILRVACDQPNEVLATAGNLNNHIGLPMTLLQLRAQHRYAVIEMGMNHLGEIDYLTRIAQPKVALINNAGTAHIGELGSRKNIAQAKGEIYAGLADDGIAVINTDDDFADYWKSLNVGKKIITFGLKNLDKQNHADVSATFTEKDGLNEVQLTTPSGSVSFRLAVLGKHNIGNALAASACAVALGISNNDIARGLSNMQAVHGRLQRKAGFNGAVVIDDTYNANPDSMKAAIDVLSAQKANTIFVMGDMAELGKNAAQMHVDIGLYAQQKGIGQFFAFGDLSIKASQAFGDHSKHSMSIDNLASTLKAQMKQGVTVLIKGSRFMQMERLVDQLLEKKNELEKKQCC
jgi:UDP-N-acetylmuramoyl-tripeptide--D-alanyl-D-alanine ligase